MDRNIEPGISLASSNSLGKRAKLLSGRSIGNQSEASGSRGTQMDQAWPEIPAPAPIPMDIDGAEAGAVEFVLSNPDLLKNIFHYLDVQDLCTAASVCSLWQTISDSDEFWSSISFEKRGITRDQVLMLCERHRTIRKLSLKGVAPGYGDEAFFGEILPRLGMMHTLEVARELLTDAVLGLISERVPALRNLILNDVTVGRYGPGEATLSHPTLTSASFLNCRTGRLKVQGQCLSSLSLHGSHITVLVATCPSLVSLDMSGCSKISDVNLRTAVTKLTSLTALNLEGNLPLSDDTLREFASQLTRLEQLNVSGCMGVTLNGVRDFHALRVLRMCGCEGLTPGTASPALESFATLEELHLDSCGLLTQLELAMPRLRRLSLRGCRALTKLELRCRWLEHVLLGPTHGTGLGCSALKQVLLASDAMMKLTWDEFPSLETVTLDCPSLNELAFFNCDALKDAVFDGVSDSSRVTAGSTSHTYSSRMTGCPSLEHLRLEACGGLHHLALRHTRLKVLTLGGCKSLSSLSIACPSLESLVLDDVPDLEALTLGPCGVPSLHLGACSNLVALALAAHQLAQLDLKGCHLLRMLQLNCPRLRSLDATFCSQLQDGALGAALAACVPPLERLVLAVCLQVGVTGLPVLASLQCLRELDLSYTEIRDVDAVLHCCTQLECLTIMSCQKLRPDALGMLLAPAPGLPPELPSLRELDVSYCGLPGSTIAALLCQGSHIETLKLNGCEGLTPEVWSQLNQQLGGEENSAAAIVPHRLQNLSLVRSSELKVLFLGLVPASAALPLISASPAPGAAVEAPESWLPARTLLADLRSLRMGLSGIQVLALSLPSLSTLDIEGCMHLRHLELRCPLLLTLFMQNCSSLPRPVLEVVSRGGAGCGRSVQVRHCCGGRDCPNCSMQH